MTESPTAATISNNDNNTRHFKFVGGPSRKRRRHNRHGEMLIDFGNNNSNKSRASFRRPLRVTGAQEAVGGEGEGKGGSQSKSPVREEAEVGEGDSNSAWAPPPSSHDAAFGEVMPQQQQQQQQQQGLWDEAAAIAPLMLTQGLMSDGMTLGDVMGLWPTGNDGPSMESPAGAGALDGVVDASHLFSGGQLPFMLPDQTPALHIPLPTVSTATAPASHASFNTEQHDINEGGSGSFSRMASPTLMRPSDNSTVIAKLFTRYDQEFCLMPVTRDFEANPFRFRAESSSHLLRHSILALCYRHLYRETGSGLGQAAAHRDRALAMLRRSDDAHYDDGGSSSKKGTGVSEGCSELDANLVLMTLDTAISAYGPWTSYLDRAKRILKRTQNANAPLKPRIQAHIAMLAWWDITLALTSRRGVILPESVILSLIQPSPPASEEIASSPSPSSPSSSSPIWDVSGCPEELFRAMIKLCRYAKELEAVAGMTCAVFDMGPVLAVERDIVGWDDARYRDPLRGGGIGIATGAGGGAWNQEDGLFSSPCDTEDIGHRLDLHHCAEAWRYALLVYIERVFKWPRPSPSSPSSSSPSQPSPVIGLLARKTLNHVSACRRSTMMQKQVLLPVVLAGCETGDGPLRDEARQYCRWWSGRTRYDMFSSAGALLEEVWAASSTAAGISASASGGGGEGAAAATWWGSVIDARTGGGDDSRSGGSGMGQFLFG